MNALQPFKVPSIGQAANNALQMRATQMNTEGNANRNALVKKQLDNYDADRERNLLERTEDREAQKELRDIQTQATAISAALKGKTKKQAQAIYENLGGDPSGKIEFTGQDVEIDYGEHTFKGPSSVVSELMENISKNSEFAKDEQTWKWFAANGGSVDKKKVEQTPDEILNDKKELETYKAGLKKKAEKPVKKHYYKINGDKSVTSYELTDAEAKTMKGLTRGKYKAATSDKALTIPQANKEITSIEGKIHAVKTKGGLMDMILDNPEFGKEFTAAFGSPESVEAKQRYLDHLESRLDELYPIVGKSRDKAPEEEGPKITHKFIDGKLVKVVKK